MTDLRYFSGNGAHGAIVVARHAPRTQSTALDRRGTEAARAEEHRDRLTTPDAPGAGLGESTQ